MSDDLVKRLRNTGSMSHVEVWETFEEAADRIEERDDIIRQGRERIEDLVSMVNSKDDRIEELEAKLTKAVEALTPSGDTKAAYIAEVETDCPCGRPHTVSWTATKDIMKMIRERAELKGGIGDE
jgi:uncharacterized protein YidB (DUF937 family)